MAAQDSLGVLTGVADHIEQPAPEPVATTSMPREAFHTNVALLARALLELRTIREAELRALTSMQRYLETIRSDGTFSGESQLLLGEISRQLDGFCSPSSAMHEMLCAAARHLEQVRLTAVVPSE